MSENASDNGPDAPEQQGWSAVNDAWERVFSAVTELGTEIAGAYKDAYVESAGEPPPSSSPAGAAPSGAPTAGHQVSDISATVETSLSAARSAFDRSVQKLSSGERTKTISRDVEAALRVSLAQLGTTFTELSEQIGEHEDQGADAGATVAGEASDNPPDAADPDAADPDAPDNVVPGPGADR